MNIKKIISKSRSLFAVFMILSFLRLTQLTFGHSNSITILPFWVNFFIVMLPFGCAFMFGSSFTRLKSPGLIVAQILGICAVASIAIVGVNQLSNPERSPLLLLTMFVLMLILSILIGMTFGKKIPERN